MIDSCDAVDPADPPLARTPLGRPDGSVETTARSADVDRPADISPPAATRFTAGQLAMLAFVVAAGRFLFARDRVVFHLAPDEPGQLAMARWLAGGVRWNMFDHSTWRPGPATLIAPLYWVTDDATSIVRGALAINAVVAGVSAIVLALLTARLTTLSRTACAAITVIVALVPSSLSASGFVWAEALVSLAFLSTLWFAIRLLDDLDERAGPRRSATAAYAAVGCSIAGFTSHSRLLPMVATTVALTFVALAWRRRWGDAIGVVLFGLAGTALSYLYADTIYDAVWDSPADNNTVETVLNRADNPLDVLDALAGQIWYQAVATIGVAVLGGALVAASLAGRREARTGDATGDPTGGGVPRQRQGARIDRRSAWALLVTIVPQVLVSATFMAQRTRPDHLVYGRYNDALLWPVLAVGLAWWIDRATTGFRRRDLLLAVATALVVVGSGAIVDSLHGDVLRDDAGVRAMVSGLLPFMGTRDAIDVPRLTLLALAAFAVWLVTAGVLARVARSAPAPTGDSSRPRAPFATVAAWAVAVVGIVATMAFAGYRTHAGEAVRLNGWSSAESIRAIDDILPDGSPVGVLVVPDSDDPVVDRVAQRQRYQLYQLYLPDHPFVRDRGPDDDVGPFVLAPVRTQVLLDANATVLWRDPNAQFALWREASGS